MFVRGPSKGNEKEDASGSEGSLPAIGSSAEHSPATSIDLLAEFLELGKDESPSSVPDDFPTFSKLEKDGGDQCALVPMQDAKEFPELIITMLRFLKRRWVSTLSAC